MYDKEFVEYIFKSISKDKGIRASLRKADSENLEWKAWSVIYPALGNLNSRYRSTYALIASFIAKSKMEKDGDQSLGEAIRFADGKTDEGVSSRILKLVSVSDSEELASVLRRLVPYLLNKDINLCFESVLSDMRLFEKEEFRQNIKAKWMTGYLKKTEEE